jgi:quercetin dioxygenase-like cupin family protein
MKRILCILLVAALPLGSVLADERKAKNVKVTLVYQHDLPNVPGKSIKGVLVEYGPGGYSPAHMHPKSAFIYATVLEGTIRSQVNDGPVRVYEAGQSFSGGASLRRARRRFKPSLPRAADHAASSPNTRRKIASTCFK